MKFVSKRSIVKDYPETVRATKKLLLENGVKTRFFIEEYNLFAISVLGNLVFYRPTMRKTKNNWKVKIVYICHYDQNVGIFQHLINNTRD